MQPFDCRICKTKNCGRSVDAIWKGGATSVSFAFLAITPTDTFSWRDMTLEPFDCRICKTRNGRRSVDTHINHI